MAYLTPSFLNLDSGIGISYVEAFPSAGAAALSAANNQSAPTILLLHGFPVTPHTYPYSLPIF